MFARFPRKVCLRMLQLNTEFATRDFLVWTAGAKPPLYGSVSCPSGLTDQVGQLLKSCPTLISDRI
jgi:hypothetical protein